MNNKVTSLELSKQLKELIKNFLKDGTEKGYGDLSGMVSHIRNAISQTEQRIVGEIEKTPEMVEAYDNDGHRYQIPETHQEDWYTFLEIPSDDERSWDVPEYAERIDGMPVTSFKKTIINLINKNNHE